MPRLREPNRRPGSQSGNQPCSRPYGVRLRPISCPCPAKTPSAAPCIWKPQGSPGYQEQAPQNASSEFQQPARTLWPEARQNRSHCHCACAPRTSSVIPAAAAAAAPGLALPRHRNPRGRCGGPLPPARGAAAQQQPQDSFPVASSGPAARGARGHHGPGGVPSTAAVS